MKTVEQEGDDCKHQSYDIINTIDDKDYISVDETQYLIPIQQGVEETHRMFAQSKDYRKYK